jgi:peptide chain release factor 2
VARTAAADFWSDPDAARAVQDEIYRLDGVLAALEHVERTVRGEVDSAQGRRRARDLAAADERLAALDQRVRHVGMLLRCQDVRDLGDAYVSLTLISARGSPLEAVAKLAGMYHAFARRRGLEVQVLDDHSGGSPPEDAITLLVGGAGGFALLRGETGLHQVSRGREKGLSGKSRAIDRDLVRVEVLPVPDRGLPDDEVRVAIHALKNGKGRLLAKPRFEAHLLHVPTMTALRACTDGPKSQAVAQLRPLLAARVAASHAPQAPTQLIRRYVLGPAPLVRDLRTGRSTGRLEKVLQGGIDLFLELMER